MKNLFEGLEGPISRRQFVQTAGILTAAAAGLRFAEAAAAFKPVRTSQYTYVAADLNKTVNWYKEVFGMQIGMKNDKTAHLWFGNPTGNTVMIVRQAAAGEKAPRIESFGFEIAAWNQGAAEATLKKMGASPRAAGNTALWFKDPDGNEVGLLAPNTIRRPAAPAEKAAVWRAVEVNHTVMLSTDYKKLAAWYKELLDLRQTIDSGRDTYLWYGDAVWIPTAVRQGEKTSPELQSYDHVAYTIENYSTDAVAAELRRRSLIPPQAETAGSLGINCVDINGFKTQVCDKELVPNAEKPRRG